MAKLFYKETGMFIDWNQIERLPDIDTLLDIGVGTDGTPELYDRYNNKKLILIDPLDEAENFFKTKMKKFNAEFHKTALGFKEDIATFYVDKILGNSSILEVSDINYIRQPIEKRKITVKKLDEIIDIQSLGKLGIKIDTEGYELNVIRGAKKTLMNTKFVLAEVRHNHESFKGVYKLHEFINEMHDNGFIMTMIVTAKPFIADLCFEPKNELI